MSHTNPKNVPFGVTNVIRPSLDLFHNVHNRYAKLTGTQSKTSFGHIFFAVDYTRVVKKRTALGRKSAKQAQPETLSTLREIEALPRKNLESLCSRLNALLTLHQTIEELK